jgi:hypothetical protein
VRTIALSETSSARNSGDIRNVKLEFFNGATWDPTNGTTALTGPTGGVYTFTDIQVGAADVTVTAGGSKIFRVVASTGDDHPGRQEHRLQCRHGRREGRGAISGVACRRDHEH